MKTYTWNVIFMGMDINFQNTENIDHLSETIQTGIENFNDDVIKSVYSTKLNIISLQFKNNGSTGNAIVYKNVNKKGKNDLIPLYQIPTFNCMDEKSYEDFFSDVVSKNNSKGDQKYIIIFLAHSFGAGFFVEKKGENKYNYFTTVQLSNAISTGFKNNNKNNRIPVDCFIALNCSLQSVETNIIFSKTANYLISSQQPLEISEVSYKELFANLIYEVNVDSENKIGINDEIIFSKFIYNCYTNYRKKIKAKNQNGKRKFDSFCLSLTTPPAARKIQTDLIKLWEVFLKDSKDPNQTTRHSNIDYWTYSSRFCDDPSYTQIVNIIDAKQFFLKLSTYYSKPYQLTPINNILTAINSTILLNVSSSSLCTEQLDENNLLKMFLPYGLGIFIPKLLSSNLTEVLKIFEKAHVAPGQIPEKEDESKMGNAIEYFAKFQNENLPIQTRNDLLSKFLEQL